MIVAKKDHLQVSSDLCSLSEVLSWFDRLCKSTLDETTWIACKTALAEGWTNAVRYGNKGLPSDTPIDIEVAISPQSIEMRIWDLGSGFDLDRTLTEKKIQLESEPEPEYGGVGLLLIKQIADQLSYTRRSDNRNCLLIVKHYQQIENSKENIEKG